MAVFRLFSPFFGEKRSLNGKKRGLNAYFSPLGGKILLLNYNSNILL